MAWTAPKTWSANAQLTAAELNEQLRDNLAETMPALAEEEGQMFFTDRENKLIPRLPEHASVTASERTASTSYVDLTTVGPSVTISTGTTAWVIHSGAMGNDTNDAQSCMTWAVSGATTIAASDSWALWTDGIDANNFPRIGGFHITFDLNPGLNTFTCKYRAGGAGTALFSDRRILVIPM